MRLLCDAKALEQVLDKLEINYKISETITLNNYTCSHEDNHSFHFTSKAEPSPEKFHIIDLSLEEIWELDKFQSNLAFRKQKISITEDCLERCDDSDIFIYEKRQNGFSGSAHHTLDRLKTYKDKHLAQNICDVYLLVPGKLESKAGTWESLPNLPHDVFNVFSKRINYHINEEYNSNFANELSRKCLGDITIELVDPNSGEIFYQDAIIGIVQHSTGMCIMEIIVQNCSVGGNKLLNLYCGNLLHFIHQNKLYSLDELLEKYHIRKYGKRRSLLFSYGEVGEEEILNTLVNEESPMGKIGGDFSQKLKTGNIALYDTAEVYVSEETMYEKCPDINIMGNKRLDYHSIEIFFVELILFQDASIDKIYIDLENEQQKQFLNPNVNDSIAKCEEISFDMAKAIRFADYNQFNFPTTRYSAKNVAKQFGIDDVFEKYELNKTLLESMIQANKRKSQENQDAIKNRFLFLLSAVTAIATLGDVFYALYQERIGGALSYLSAFAIMAIIYVIYKLVLHINFYIKERGTRKNET